MHYASLAPFDRADYREAHECAEAASKTNDANALALFAVLELAGESFGYNGAPSSERRAMAVRLADQAFRLKAFDAFQHSQDDETILNALNLGSATLSPSLQVIEMALRTHVGDQNGAERMRRSLQVLGFTQLSDYLDLIDRECWTKEVKKTIQQLFATN